MFFIFTKSVYYCSFISFPLTGRGLALLINWKLNIVTTHRPLMNLFVACIFTFFTKFLALVSFRVYKQMAILNGKRLGNGVGSPWGMGTREYIGKYL